MSTQHSPNDLRQSVIVAWSGPFYTIPDGWQVCDGTRNTPNLTERFVVGGGNAFQYNTQGGAASHRHMVKQAGIAATGVVTRNANGESVSVACPGTVTTSPSDYSAVTDALPPYVSLYFITPSN